MKERRYLHRESGGDNDVLKCATHIEWCVKRANRISHKFPNRTFGRECTVAQDGSLRIARVYLVYTIAAQFQPRGAVKASICMQVDCMRICARRYRTDILPFRDIGCEIRHRRGWRTTGKHMSSCATLDNALIGLWDAHSYTCARVCASVRTACNSHKSSAQRTHDWWRERETRSFANEIRLSHYTLYNVIIIIFIIHLLSWNYITYIIFQFVLIIYL